MNNFRQWLIDNFQTFTSQDWAVVLMRITMIILWTILGYVLVKLLAWSFSRRLNRGFKVKDDKHAKTITKLVSNISYFLLSIFLFIVIMSELGVDIATIIAGAGIVGLAVGFGAQELIKDLISGFFIIAERIFSVGERIEYNGFVGYVQQIGLRTTIIENWRNESLIVNNSDIRAVKNLARKNSVGVVRFKVAYGTDLSYFGDQFTDFLNQASTKYETMIGVPSVTGVVDTLDGGITLQITFQALNSQFVGVERGLNRDIYQYLIDNKISLPGVIIDIE